jgi:uncharacterized phage-associated protein
MKTANFTATQIASYFINKANTDLVDDNLAEGISNLKLQKILYFAQAANVCLNDALLFDDKIEAWKYGPVVPTVYRQYKSFNNLPITKIEEAEPSIEAELREFLDNTWDVFGKYSAGQLVELTHQHKPWKEAFESDDNVIEPEALKEYYSEIFIAA